MKWWDQMPWSPIRWPKYWSFSISPSNEYSDWFPLGLTDLISLQYKEFSRVFSNTTAQKASFLQHSAFFMAQLSHPYMTTGKIIALTYTDLCWQSGISATDYKPTVLPNINMPLLYSPTKVQSLFNSLAELQPQKVFLFKILTQNSTKNW